MKVESRHIGRVVPGVIRRRRLVSHASWLAGFSLLELLVVLAIVGIVATFAVLSVGTADGDRVLEREAERLGALVGLSCEEAILRGESLALSFGPGGTGYGFLRLAGEQWLPRRGETWRPRFLPGGFRADLRVEDRQVELDQANAGRPHLVCLASGELIPFDVRLRGPGTEAVWRVSGEWDGDVAIERINDRA